MKAYVVGGLAYGDEGKGAVTDHLVRRLGAEVVIRYNGGPQAAHNVISPGGLHHTFSQIGSGALAGARTFLSRHMLIDPVALYNEAEILASKMARPLDVTIDPRCVIITPYHVRTNRLVETARGDKRHSSVGMGVGQARMDQLDGVSLTVEDILRGNAVDKLLRIREKKVGELRDLAMPIDQADELLDLDIYYARDAYLRILSDVRVAPFAKAMHGVETAVFEGAQGFLLDESYGFAPYNSWTNCTFENADDLLDEIDCASADRHRIGVLRSYSTRHGAGPFVTEDCGTVRAPELHNATHPWMGAFRQGHFDLVSAKYACDIARPDHLIITHMDTRPSAQVATAYDTGSGPLIWEASELMNVQPTYDTFPEAGKFIEEIEMVTGVEIMATSWSPTSAGFEYRAVR